MEKFSNRINLKPKLEKGEKTKMKKEEIVQQFLHVKSESDKFKDTILDFRRRMVYETSMSEETFVKFSDLDELKEAHDLILKADKIVDKILIKRKLLQK